MDLSDSLVLSGASGQPGEKLYANLRFIQEDKIFADQITLDLSAGDRTVKQATYNFSSSFFQGVCTSQIQLSDVSVEATVATTRGQTFARLNLFRKGVSTGQATTTKPTKCVILSDYVTTMVTACLRNSRNFTPIEGPGYIYPIAFAIPPVGTDWTITVPPNVRWKLVSGFAGFATSAANVQRCPRIQIQEGGTVCWLVPSLTSIGPNLLATYSFAGISVPLTNPINTVYATGAPGIYNFVIPTPPDLRLIGGSSFISSETVGLDVGDQWGGPNLLVEEWLDNV